MAQRSSLPRFRSDAAPARPGQRHARLAACIVLALVVLPAVGRAATVAGWDVHGMPGGSNNFGPSPLAATTADANVTVGGLARGAGVGTSGTGAARGWGGVTFTGTTEAAAIAAGQYATFTVTARAGYQVSFSTVSSWGYRRSSTGPSSGALQYQIGSGAFQDAALVSYTSTSSSGATLGPVDLSGIPALQNVSAGTTVTFRIVSWGGTSSSGTWYVFDAANSAATDLEVQGVVAPAGPTLVRVETAADGSGTVVPAQTLGTGSSVTAYAISRDAAGVAYGNVAATWSLASVSGGIVPGDLVAAPDGKSATFTAHAGGTAVLRASVSGLSSVDSGTVTVVALPTPIGLVAGTSRSTAAEGDVVVLTATVTPGLNPTSSGVVVTGDTSPLGGPATAVFHDDGLAGDAIPGDGVYSYQLAIPPGLAPGTKTVTVSAIDDQARTASDDAAVRTLGSFGVLHVNDTHARITPHKWVIPEHAITDGEFEDVGGAAYLAAAMLQLTAAQPDDLVIDAGDISEGNPVGDMNGNEPMTRFYQLLSTKLRGQRGRGMDAVVVGNHDVRDATYIANLDALQAAGVPVLSVNVRDVATHQPHFAPWTIVTVHGTRVGILGYTTEAAEVGASLAGTLEVAPADWNGTDPGAVHMAPLVNELRNDHGCDVVILVAHVGDSRIATTTTIGGAATAALLLDDGAAKLPEIVVTGHWHTWAETVWQPDSLDYKTIVTESNSYMHYVGELQVTGSGRYLSSTQHPVRDADYAPDPDVDAFVRGLMAQYDATHPIALSTVVGWTADDLMLDNRMKWWSADEYPWSGDNSAGQWICDAMQWKATQLFGQADLAIEAGGGVRADIPRGPVTYLQVYETFPWGDDTFYRVNMTGQEIIDFLTVTGMDAGFSRGLEVTASDGVPALVTFNGQPIDPLRVYTVAINSYMYAHPPAGFTWSDPSPRTSSVLCRDGLVDFMRNFPSADQAYTVGGPRYQLDTEFSGGYRAVVTMMNDDDTRPAYEDAFIRLLSATPETLARRGSPEVPTDLVNADGTVVPDHHLAEQELYRSYLGFKKGVLRPGDIVEVWGKGSFYQGNPEFVDQEGVYGDGIEFRIVGHDESLAKPTFMRSVGAFWDDFHKNHFVKFLARKAGADTVTDQYGQTLKLWDETAYASKSPVPGAVGDLLVVTGIPTMESFSLRFRCHTVDLAASQGVTDFPAASGVTSTLVPLFPYTTRGSVTLAAATSLAIGTYVFPPVADAQVASGNGDTNYGSSSNVYLQSSASGYANERGWLRFDLSALPAGATVTSARLGMWCWKAAGPALDAEVHGGASDAWAETGITWNNQPAFGPALDTQTLAAGAANRWYSWDVTAFAAGKLGGNALVSLLVKPAVEGSTASPAPSYAFDAKEYGSNAPVLTVVTAPASTTVAGATLYARYSADGSTWTAWSPAATCAGASCQASFDLAQGYGYYEFYSAGRDGTGGTEAVAPFAQSFVHYAPVPPFFTEAIVLLSNLAQTYDGRPHPVTVTTIPSVGAAVTYGGASTPPVHAGSYPVAVAVAQPGYSGAGAGTLVVDRAQQAIAFGALQRTRVGAPQFSLTASATSGLDVQYTSSNPSVAQVSGSTVTVVGAGTATLTAAQPGNGDFYPAPAVAQALIVDPPAVQVEETPGAPAAPGWAWAALALAMAGLGAARLERRRG